jgi:thioredoxin-dependent peroxiredoxin
MTRLATGDRAPTFTLLSDANERVALTQYRGRRVVVYFYPADDTPGCTTEACDFNAEMGVLRRLQVDVLGISPDDVASHRRFKEKFGLTFPLLSDPTHAVMIKYGAFGEKKLYGRTVTGVIRSTFGISATGSIETAAYGV